MDREDSDGRRTGRRWLYRGLQGGCATILVVLVAATLLPMLSQSRSGIRINCPDNLNRIGLSLKMYANESPGELYPPIAADVGTLMFEPLTVYPEYVPDPTAVMLCPDDPDVADMARGELDYDGFDLAPKFTEEDFLDDQSYFYLGYALRNDQDMELFARAYRLFSENGRPLTDDIVVQDGPDRKVLYRLREGVEQLIVDDEREPDRPFGTDDYRTAARMQSDIPLLIERLDNHDPQGGYVVYLDGHVEFMQYLGKWPLTERTVSLLNELDALGEMSTQ